MFSDKCPDCPPLGGQCPMWSYRHLTFDHDQYFWGRKWSSEFDQFMGKHYNNLTRLTATIGKFESIVRRRTAVVYAKYLSSFLNPEDLNPEEQKEFGDATQYFTDVIKDMQKNEAIIYYFKYHGVEFPTMESLLSTMKTENFIHQQNKEREKKAALKEAKREAKKKERREWKDRLRSKGLIE